jgi:hypothetical protein
MLASLWLAVAGLPVFHQPFAAVPDAPAAIALASNEVTLRRPCLRLRCADSEWRPPAAATTYAYREAERKVVRTPLPGAAMPGVRSLPAPGRRDWVKPYAGLDRIGGRYGLTVVDKPNTGLDVEFGTGYRWQPYVDNGSADVGPVARGRVELRQKLGEHALLLQETRIEAGRDNAFVRNSLGLEVQLQPQWSLSSDVEVRHDTAADGGKGRTDTTGNVRLEYAF